MPEDDVSYFRRRAEAELVLAQQANKPEVVRTHRQLADAYLERIALAEPAQQIEHA